MEILGIDIGGSGIKGAPVNTKTGEMLAERLRFPTPDPATPAEMISVVKDLVDHFNWTGGIGCGFPAAIHNETVMTAANIDQSWIGLNASEEMEKVTNCPTHLINDVDAAGTAEMKFGAGKKEKGIVIMVAVGTGIGGAIFNKGRLQPNVELGHVILPNGIVGEKFASNQVRKDLELSWEDWAERFNVYLSRVQDLFWPDLFIMGGGISKYFETFGQFITSSVEIRPAELLNNAGIIGAAYSAKKVVKKGLEKKTKA